MKLILASQSPFRRRQLSDLGFVFEVQKPEVDEDNLKQEFIKKNNSPHELCQFLAIKKGQSIADKYPQDVVLGCDQLIEFENEIIGKGHTFSQTVLQLKKLQGKTHTLWTALSIFNQKNTFNYMDQTKVKMRTLSDFEIESYVKKDQPWGCAGSYKYESLGKHLFEKTTGDYYAVLGLSIQPLIAFMHQQKLILIKS